MNNNAMKNEELLKVENYLNNLNETYCFCSVLTDGDSVYYFKDRAHIINCYDAELGGETLYLLDLEATLENIAKINKAIADRYEDLEENEDVKDMLDFVLDKFGAGYQIASYFDESYTIKDGIVFFEGGCYNIEEFLNGNFMCIDAKVDTMDKQGEYFDCIHSITDFLDEYPEIDFDDIREFDDDFAEIMTKYIELSK